MITPYTPTDGQGNPGAPFDGFTFTPQQIADGDIARQADLAAAAPPMPQPTPQLSGQTVDMLGPDGARYSVPKENASKAQEQGFRLETPEERDIHDFNKAHPWAEPLTAWYKGVVSGSTLGLVDDKQIGWLVENVAPLMGSKVSSDQVQKYIKKAEEQHGFIAGAGDVAAMLLTLPVATSAMGVGVRGGTAAARFVAGEAGAKVAGSWAGRTALEGIGLSLPKAFREVVEGDPIKAAESVAYGAGGNLLFMGAFKGGGKLLKSMPSSEGLANELAGRSVGGTVTRGKLIKGWGGDGDVALKEAGKFSREMIPFQEKVFGEKADYHRNVESWIDLVMEDMPETAADWDSFAAKAGALGADVERAVAIRKQLGVSPSKYMKLADEAGGWLNKQEIDGVTGKFVEPPPPPPKPPAPPELEIGASPSDAKWPPKPTDEAPVWKDSEELLPSGEPLWEKEPGIGGFDVKAFKDAVKERLREMSESPIMTAEANMYKGVIEKMIVQAERDVESVFAGERLSFEKVWNWRRELDKKIQWDKLRVDPMTMFRKELRAALDGELERQSSHIMSLAAEHAPEKFTGSMLEELNKNQDFFRKARLWSDALADDVMRESANRHMQISDNSWGVATALAGAMTGAAVPIVKGVLGAYAHRFARLKGNIAMSKVISKMPTIEASMRSFGSGFVGMPAAIEGTMPNAKPAFQVLPKEVFNQWMSPGGEPAPAVSGTAGKAVVFQSEPENGTVSSYVRLANDITRLASDPAQLQARVSEITDHLMKESPVVAQSVAQHYGNLIAHLNKVMPKADLRGNPYSPAKPSFSKTELQTFAERLLVADDPHVVQQFLSTRTLKQEHLETLFTVWPAAYRNFVERIQDHAMSGQARPIDYKGQLQLSLLTGIAMTPHMSPQAMQGYQKLYVQESMGGAPGMQGVMKAANMSRLKGQGKESLTIAQRLEMR